MDLESGLSSKTIPPHFRECIKPDAQANRTKIQEYSRTLEQVPINHHYKGLVLGTDSVRQVQVGSEIRLQFDGIPGLAFSPEKLLVGCLISRGKKTILYPHTKPSGEVDSASSFEVSPYQRYFIERQARDALAAQGELKKLTPDRQVTNKYGTFNITQEPDGQIAIIHLRSRKEARRYKDGLMDLPVGNITEINILFNDQPNGEYATHSSVFDSYVMSKLFLQQLIKPETSSSRITPQERLTIVMRHELNHGFFSQLDDAQKSAVVKLFPTDHPGFKMFLAGFTREKQYREAAAQDLQIDPTMEKIEVDYQGQKIVIGKNRVVDELLAYASWAELVDRDRITMLRHVQADGVVDQHAELLMKSAADFLAQMPDEAKQKLKDSNLVHEKGSPVIEEYIKAFSTAVSMLGQKHIK